MKIRIIGAILVIVVLALCVLVVNDAPTVGPSKVQSPTINNDVDFKNLKIN